MSAAKPITILLRSDGSTSRGPFPPYVGELFLLRCDLESDQLTAWGIAFTQWWESRPRAVPHIPNWSSIWIMAQSIIAGAPNVCSGMVDFVHRTHLHVAGLVYYPPYHSKYNSVERLRGHPGEPLAWERCSTRWRPSSGFARTMTWKGLQPGSGTGHDNLPHRRDTDPRRPWTTWKPNSSDWHTWESGLSTSSALTTPARLPGIT